MKQQTVCTVLGKEIQSPDFYGRNYDGFDKGWHKDMVKKSTEAISRINQYLKDTKNGKPENCAFKWELIRLRGGYKGFLHLSLNAFPDCPLCQACFKDEEQYEEDEDDLRSLAEDEEGLRYDLQ